MMLRPVLILACFLGILSGCSGPSSSAGPVNDPIASLLLEEPVSPGAPEQGISQLGYTVQVGAFSNLENAVRLERQLGSRGIDAYYFRHDSGLYKVRFGDYIAYDQARSAAERLQGSGLIETFFIVTPEAHTAARIRQSGHGNLRTELVKTARRFIGVPYRWGGEDSRNGFDCSGLTMVCYRLNGLNLPRNSRSQFSSGRWVAKAKLRPGDLVFFATRGGKRVSHVGMFIGSDRFIHAPRTGKKVRIEKMSNKWFARRYMGGRTYL
ncbi:MAG: hydrolase [Desulfuromonas sp.]|nr:MAG: hydrolase [Desulfuromonas sp.]